MDGDKAADQTGERPGDRVPAPRGRGRVSPLGRLYRKEYQRLRARFPDQDAEERDRCILLTLALAFLDVDAEELAQAMVEGHRVLSNQFSRYAWFAKPEEVTCVVGEARRLRYDGHEPNQ